MLERKVEHLERECARRQSLLRLSQRALGVPPSQTAAAKPGKRKPKKPTVRALRVAAQLGLQAEPGREGKLSESDTTSREAPSRGLGTKSPGQRSPEHEAARTHAERP